MEVPVARLSECKAPFKPLPSTVLTSAVGYGALNKKTDVRIVQQLLNNMQPGDGGPAVPLKEDGIVGPKTNAAIVAYQRKLMSGFADGVVSPGMKTVMSLKEKVTKSGTVGKVGDQSSFPEDRYGNGAVPLALAMLKLLQPSLLNLSFKLARSSAAALTLASKHFAEPGTAVTGADVDYLQTVLRDLRTYIDRANAFGDIQAANTVLFYDEPGLLGFTVRGGDKMTVNDLQLYADDDGTTRNYPGQTVFITGLWSKAPLAEQQLTLIHEFCHFVGDRDDQPGKPPNPNKIDDHAYIDNPKMSVLSKALKLRNAESLALFFLEYCIGTHALMSIKPNANEAMLLKPPIVFPGGDRIQV